MNDRHGPNWLSLLWQRAAGSFPVDPRGSNPCLLRIHQGSGFDCDGHPIPTGHADFPKSPVTWV